MPRNHPILIRNKRYNSAYTRIWQGAGDNISWFNCQFYNNPSYSSPASSKVSYYEIFAGIIGASELLMGVPLNPAGSGYLPLDQFTSQVIAPLLQTFGPAFGGVMGWEFSYDQCGTWAEGTAQALAGGTGMPAWPNGIKLSGAGISQKTTLVSGVSRAGLAGFRVLYRPPGRLVFRS